MYFRHRLPRPVSNSGHNHAKAQQECALKWPSLTGDCRSYWRQGKRSHKVRLGYGMSRSWEVDVIRHLRVIDDFVSNLTRDMAYVRVFHVVSLKDVVNRMVCESLSSRSQGQS